MRSFLRAALGLRTPLIACTLREKIKIGAEWKSSALVQMDFSQWHCLLPKTSTLAPCVAKERATSERLAHTCSYYLSASFHLYRWVKCCVRGVSLDSMIIFFFKLLTVAIGSIRNY